jgi:hypothetical protein
MRGGSEAVVKQRRGIRPIPVTSNPLQGLEHDPRAPRSTPVVRRRPNHDVKRSATATLFFPPLCAQNLARQGRFRRAQAVWVEGREGGMKRGGRQTGSRSYKNVERPEHPTNLAKSMRPPCSLESVEGGGRRLTCGSRGPEADRG